MKLIRKGEDVATYTIRLITFAKTQNLFSSSKGITKPEIEEYIIKNNLVELFESHLPSIRAKFDFSKLDLEE